GIRTPPGLRRCPRVGGRRLVPGGRSPQWSVIARATLTGGRDARLAGRARDPGSLGCGSYVTLRPRSWAPRPSFARAPSPGGFACCTVLAVTAADHVVAVGLGGHEGERAVGAVRHVGTDSPPAGIHGDPALDLAGASLEVRRPIDECPAFNVSVMFLDAVRSHVHRHGKAGLVGPGGDGHPGFGGCEGVRRIFGCWYVAARYERACACEVMGRELRQCILHEDKS